MTDYEGRLELTWTNKALRLLAQEDGHYEWVPPGDFRVAEVRLLHDVAEVGEVGPVNDRARDNLLIRGDALHALTSLAELPEFSPEYLGKVKLAYLDPPFNTGQSFLHYDDALEHSVWLGMMRDRLLQVKRLLSPDGSVWVHLDDSEMAYCRVMVDEILGRENFVGTVVWEKAQGAKGDTDLAASHDYVLVYAKDKSGWRNVRNLLPRTEDQLARYANPDSDPRGPWRQGADSSAKSGGDENRWPITLPSGRIVRPARGRYWAFSHETFERALREGRIYFGRDGDGLPVIKTYLSSAKEGVVPKTWWPASEVGSNQEAKRDHLNRMFPDLVPFATPKPERLIHRIVSIATRPGDIVLDPFVGSGTTAAVAHKMLRRWVAIERDPDTVSDYTVPRLVKVVTGEDPGGVTETTGWEGGGGYRLLEVGPSMFEDDAGRVVLADWAVNNKLAEATAAQLGYQHEPQPPFCGRKGRTRLAVVDGLVNENVVELLVGVLPEGELLTVCGTAVDPEARLALKAARPGSALKKIPASLLSEYRLPRRSGPPDLAAWASLGDGTTEQAGKTR